MRDSRTCLEWIPTEWSLLSSRAESHLFLAHPNDSDLVNAGFEVHWGDLDIGYGFLADDIGETDRTPIAGPLAMRAVVGS